MKKLFFLATMTSVFFCSCNRNEDPITVPSTAELRFNNVSMAAVLTRADAYSESFKIYMYEDAVYDAVDRQVDFTGGQWVIAGETVYLGPNSRDLYAYAPVTAVYDPVAKTFPMISKKEGDAEDLLYQKVTGLTTVDAGNVDVTLKHAYARVKVTLTHTQYAGKCILNALSIADIAQTGTFNIEDGTASVTGEVGELELVAVGGNVVFPAGNDSPAALVVPMKTATLKIKCTLDDKDYGTITVPATISKLDPGYEYTINLTVSGTEVAVKSVGVSPWVAGEAGEVVLK